MCCSKLHVPWWSFSCHQHFAKLQVNSVSLSSPSIQSILYNSRICVCALMRYFPGYRYKYVSNAFNGVLVTAQRQLLAEEVLCLKASTFLLSCFRTVWVNCVKVIGLKLKTQHIYTVNFSNTALLVLNLQKSHFGCFCLHTHYTTQNLSFR